MCVCVCVCVSECVCHWYACQSVRERWVYCLELYITHSIDRGGCSPALENHIRGETCGQSERGGGCGRGERECHQQQASAEAPHRISWSMGSTEMKNEILT